MSDLKINGGPVWNAPTSNLVNITWQISIVDTVDEPNGVAINSSVGFNAAGQPAVAYSNRTNLEIRYAVFNGSTWDLSTVETGQDTNGYPSLAFRFGDPAISYQSGQSTLEYAYWRGSTWSKHRVASISTAGGTSSLAFNPSKKPVISYFDSNDNTLKFATSNHPSTWIGTTVDPTPHAGFSHSLAVNAAGHPAIAYHVNGTPDEIRFAEFNGQTWDIQQIAKVAQGSGWISLAFSPAGEPAMSYFDSNTGALIFQIFRTGRWLRYIVDFRNAGTSSSLAFSPSGQPAISYEDHTNKTLKFAIFDGAKWSNFLVDDAGAVGSQTSLKFNPSGQPGISYFDRGGRIKFAIGTITPATPIFHGPVGGVKKPAG